VNPSEDAWAGAVGIVFAVPHEMGSVLPRLRGVRWEWVAGVRSYFGDLAGRRVIVMAAGMGEAADGPAGELLSRAPRLARIWIAGYGGGLDPALHLGDVVVSPELPPGFTPPELLRGRRAVAGKILHVSRVIASPEAKARLLLESGAACCEMESGVIGPIADRLGIPWAGVRAISDAASDRLPEGLLAASWDAKARRPTPGRLLPAMLRRPWEAMAFLRFVSGLGLARENLGRVLERLVAAVVPAWRQR
jgi:nucleoside phosphorylase